MRKRSGLIRAAAILATAAACAIAFDAAIVLADDAAPATRPAVAAAPSPPPSTQPALVGGSISSDYARTLPQPVVTPRLMPSQSGGSSTNTPASVTVGAGVDPGQGDAAAVTPQGAGPGYGSGPTSRPTMRVRR